MLVDTLAVRLRPRTPNEAIDLGVRLCQSAAPAVWRCYLVAAVPVIALALASTELIGWWATFVMWWMKPWLDRTILFVLSRAAFGQPTTVGDLWRSQWRVWWRPFLFTVTVRRLSLWRSLTEPVYLLEDGPAIGSGRSHLADPQSSGGLGVHDDAGLRHGGDRRLRLRCSRCSSGLRRPA